MSQSSVDEFIEHYGVKGMHWGVRNPRNRVKTGKTKTTYTKPGHKLSDEQLSKRIKRMEMEKRYKDLNQPDIHKGRKFATDF